MCVCVYMCVCIHINIYIYIYTHDIIHDRARSARSSLIQQEAAPSTETDGMDKAEAELHQNQKKLKLRRHLCESRSQVNLSSASVWPC
jgi:hypothetical protein